MPVVKVIQLIGISDQNWEDAAKIAVAEAHKTIRNITGVHVVSQTAEVRKGQIFQFKTTCNVAFTVER